MFIKFITADLIRNPRRTLSTVVGVLLGTGLFCALLFFVDGLSTSMTQRAVAPLPIDMQRIMTEPVAGDLRLDLAVTPVGPVQAGSVITVHMTLANLGDVPANEVTLRSAPGDGLTFKSGSAMIDDQPLIDNGNPFSKALTQAGRNIGRLEPQQTVSLSYDIVADQDVDIAPGSIVATFATRESLFPVAANTDERTDLHALAAQIAAVDHVAYASPLMFSDLPPGALSSRGAVVAGPLRMFGLDADYLGHDASIRIVEGTQRPGAAMVSVEAAAALGVSVGDNVTIALPDGSSLDQQVSGLLDLSLSRSLFNSRRGADFESFLYVPNSIVVDTATFDSVILPAYLRAITTRGERVKSPPVREIDIGIARDLLDAEPALALIETRAIAAEISAIAGGQDFLLDNISNTLAVAREDANVAKRMFTALGLPGAMLAAMLSAYAGIVLGEAQRRERATLRIRGASRRNLLVMLVLRVIAITTAGAMVGVGLGYASASLVLGQEMLARATTARLLLSGLLGAVVGLLATGTALYLTGRRSIDAEIAQDRAQLWARTPIWRRVGLDIAVLAGVGITTVIVLAQSGFEGTPGSVYIGQAVHLPLWLLVLPIGLWIAGCLFGGRLFVLVLDWLSVGSAPPLDRPFALLLFRSIKRRSWAMADAAIILALIVSLGTSLAVFTASYDAAKGADARFTLGSDIRIARSPTRDADLGATDVAPDMAPDAAQVTAVMYGVQNIVLRSDRTTEVANLAAVDPTAFSAVVPLADADFSTGSADLALGLLRDRPETILLSRDIAAFIKVDIGTTIHVLLGRNTPDQVEVPAEVVGLFDRLPGFPDGADALMNIALPLAMVPSARPAFLLMALQDRSDDALQQTVARLQDDPAIAGLLQVESRLTALARDQSSLAALNINGLLKIDSGYVLAMGTVTMAIFVFGLLLQRRREYVTLKALGMPSVSIQAFIASEAGLAVLAGCLTGVPVGLAMAWYFINVLRPLFVLDPPFHIPFESLGWIVGAMIAAAAVASVAASSLINGLRATELLRDD